MKNSVFVISLVLTSWVNSAFAQLPPFPLKVELEVSRETWETDLPLGASLQPMGEYLEMSNRALLLSRTEWAPGTLSLEWKPLNLPGQSDDPTVNTDENIRLYGDHLAILLSSTGQMTRMKDGRGGDASDGVIIKFNAGIGVVWIHRATPEGSVVLKSVELGREAGKPAISPEFHKVAIKDDGKLVSVRLDDKDVIEMEISADVRKGKKWGIYNREPVGPPGPHVSHIKNLSLER